MDKIKILIADDSVVYRSQIKMALASFQEVEVVATANNGRIAIDKMLLGPVDLLILDLEMPELDGIETLKEIAERKISCTVLIFSSLSKRGAEVTLEALRLGATDFITKPGNDETIGEVGNLPPEEKIRLALAPKLTALFNSKKSFSRDIQTKKDVNHKMNWDLFTPKIVLIGSSTGGPTVLEKIFSGVSGQLKCPIVIAQHMPPIFTATLAERLSRLCGIPAKEASEGEILNKNCIYIAPGNYHLRVKGTQESPYFTLDQSEQINYVRPAVDPLFESASEIFQDRCLAFVLTGMGHDGLAGAQAIKKKGGAVVIQEESSCVVFGMPGAVFQSGSYDAIKNPDEILQMLLDMVTY